MIKRIIFLFAIIMENKMDIEYDENFVYVEDEAIPAIEFMSLEKWKMFIEKNDEDIVKAFIIKKLKR